MIAKEYKAKVRFIAESVNAEGVSAKAIAQINSFVNGEIVILENIRFASGEKSNDGALRDQLASLGDVYVVDAFGAVHREHASMMPTTKTENAVGLLAGDEVTQLYKALAPRHPMVAIFGGAKVEDKVDVLNAFIEVMKAGIYPYRPGLWLILSCSLAQDPTASFGKSLVQKDKVSLAAA